MVKPKLYVNEMPHGMFKIRQEGQGTFLYKNREEMVKLIYSDDYEIVYEGVTTNHG